ncbi:hypothetical protein Kpol_1030p40 [Vanderwaltozyma polyspora DSM 70294]|uniref:Histone acetyltransferase n=1 Tax=Vanderwaltozyma polyspora (strain ATCC 22028 / DSM 70294 / BCRC 21397 / CBS 2163 / NBRC 10782 / NRRL Y-8283 / UCD 57-17) TaxID=436907 RepID=A7TMV8_VANPO|nr:uncharacterized protein Kpol_1030p40 [Vanderwaltozyma polyspora DSM 70294]EDO16430.1 hypothetical protein Kpol_1030p40 [Vanderwaltozyma polyspora DSM 70294]
MNSADMNNVDGVIPINNGGDDKLKKIKKRRDALLRNLIIDDNIHSQVSKVALENPDKRRSRRVNTPVSYVYKRKAAYGFEQTVKSRRKSKRSNVKNVPKRIQYNEIKQNNTVEQEPSNDSTIPPKPVIENPPVNVSIYGIPKTAEEFNTYNPNVQLNINSDSTEIKPQLDMAVLKIKYDPLKCLNFDNILRTSQRKDVESLEHNNIHDFEITESEELINMLDNYSLLPFRGAINKSKDASTHKTTPNIVDRQFFKSLLDQSSMASFCNANVLLASHPDPNEPDFLNRDSKGRLKRKNKSLKYRGSVTTKNSNTKSIEFIYLRNYEIKTWYTTPYPEEYNKNKILFICEFCLKYMNSRYIYYRHQLKCTHTHPPGNEIYRDGKISVWEVDGRENVIYCQNLCLLAKLFLNSKTLYYDVEPFIFYILTEREDEGYQCPRFHLVGYYSHEKLNSTDYNLSCILTLPIYQRKGYGHFLMDFSYLLTKRAYKLGTPEKPLSDLGLLSYRNFWKIKCAQVLLKIKETILTNSESIYITLEDISNLTGMIPTDVVLGLEQLGVLYQKTVIDKEQENKSSTSYCIIIDSWDRIQGIYDKWKAKGYIELKSSKLIWKPMIFGPSCGVNAVGTSIETVSNASKDLTVPGQVQSDFFKNSISMLVNFMKDDIIDPRPMEEVAMEEIKKRQLHQFSEIKQDISNWRLSFVEPNLEERSIRSNGINSHNSSGNKTKFQKSSLDATNKVEKTVASDSEPENIIEEIDEIEDKEDDAYEIDEENEEESDEDEYDEGEDDDIQTRKSRRNRYSSSDSDTSDAEEFVDINELANDDDITTGKENVVEENGTITGKDDSEKTDSVEKLVETPINEVGNKKGRTTKEIPHREKPSNGILPKRISIKEIPPKNKPRKAIRRRKRRW